MAGKLVDPDSLEDRDDKQLANAVNNVNAGFHEFKKFAYPILNRMDLFVKIGTLLLTGMAAAFGASIAGFLD